MQKTKHFAYKLLAFVLVAALCITTIPIAFADEPEPEYITLGTYEGNGIEWEVLKSFDVEGSTHKLLIAKTVVGKRAFNSPAVKNPKFAESALFTFLNGEFFNSFSDEQKGIIVDHTVTYGYNLNGATQPLVEDSVTCKVFIPTAADKEEYSLTQAGGNYWLCDGVAGANATVAQPGNRIQTVQAAAGVAQATGSINFRPMIEIDADKIFMTTDIASGITVTDNAGEEIGKLVLTNTLPMILNISRTGSAGVLAVTLNGVALEGEDGVYTISEGLEGLLTSGNVLKAAVTVSYANYEAALAKVDEIHKDFYNDSQLADLNAALANDVSGLPYSIANQVKVDNAARAIVTALDNLPADDEAVKEALAEYRYIVQNKGASSSDAIAPYSANFEDLYKNYNFYTDEGGQALKDQTVNAKDKYEDRDLLSGKASNQALMDAFVAEITPLLDQAIANKTEKPADNNGQWSQAVADTEKLLTEGNRYQNVEEFYDRAKEIIDEYNAEFGSNTPVMSDKDKVQSYIDRVNAVIDECHANANVIKTDYSAYDAAVAKAATYVEDHYYKDDEMEGGTAAWNDFVKTYESVASLLDGVDREDVDNTWNHAFASQSRIDSETKKLEAAMKTLDKYVRLNSVQKTLNKILNFFNKIKYYYDMVTGILETLRGLIKMLVAGDINLYEVFELIGVDQKVLDFLIKIGIKPPVEEPEVTE